jgi:hypothetical protein
VDMTLWLANFSYLINYYNIDSCVQIMKFSQIEMSIHKSTCQEWGFSKHWYSVNWKYYIIRLMFLWEFRIFDNYLQVTSAGTKIDWPVVVVELQYDKLTVYLVGSCEDNLLESNQNRVIMNVENKYLVSVVCTWYKKKKIAHHFCKIYTQIICYCACFIIESHTI